MIKRDLDIKDDVVVDGKKYLLSTVELFYCYYGYKYETMLFPYEGEKVCFRELCCYRWVTKSDAQFGHSRLLIRLKGGEKIWEL